MTCNTSNNQFHLTDHFSSSDTEFIFKKNVLVSTTCSLQVRSELNINKEIAGSKKCLLSIKGRSCNQTLLVHQDMTKKTTFYEK